MMNALVGCGICEKGRAAVEVLWPEQELYSNNAFLQTVVPMLHLHLKVAVL